MPDTLAIELNCDMGEGFGRWSVAPDADIMPLISTANIACGFHAGDPRIIRDTVALAADCGVQIGAHVSLQDMRGFGRRRIDLAPEELRDDVIYQLGSLRAFADIYGVNLAHVKPHGVLYNMIQQNSDYAEAVAQAISEVDPKLLWYVLDETVQPIASARGLNLVPEGFVDLDYDSSGGLIIERRIKARDPQIVAERAVRLVTEGTVVSRDGTMLQLDRRTICLHADAPGALEIIKLCRRRLEEAGIEVRSVTNQRSAAE